MPTFNTTAFRSRVKRAPLVVDKDAAILAVAGLTTWFDAARGVSLDGSNNVQALADRVSGAAGYGQTTAAARPNILPAGIGGRTALQFVASTKERLDFKGSFPNGSFTKYVLAQPSGLASNGMLYGTALSPKHSFYVNGTTVGQGIGAGGVGNTLAFAAGVPLLFIASWNAATGVASVAINDGAPASYAYGVQGSALATTLFIGSETALSQNFDGLIGEGLLVSGADHLAGQSPADYALILSYLGAKYGVFNVRS